ncbi:helix-turn-helix domain-containing protein [Frigoriflavimonas asaccharolytica]|uniref:Transcriptional regulator with XRE-family HTH domain n=1 Tax=Frigoriflavimonas asaccharolytica TaxID=2735899 RepID=A0A8J8K850_9FLAO|nr:helix-turn-helix transcriptional regulator [Frigoriflavimonas asaccharolytica]NRS92221.1 transcriptional regulator with XRE-family HTH domain [Frigoriflavimonas asaccharolytica]
MQNQDEIILIKIGKKIQEIRLAKNLTQKDIAFALDVEISQITRIERGKINTSILNILKIIDALDVSKEEFFAELEI